MPMCFSVEVVFQLRCVDEIAIMSGANTILVRSSAWPLRERKASRKPLVKSRDSQGTSQLISEGKQHLGKGLQGSSQRKAVLLRWLTCLQWGSEGVRGLRDLQLSTLHGRRHTDPCTLGDLVLVLHREI